MANTKTSRAKKPLEPTPHTTAKYNLLKEPWIPVLTSSSSKEERVSINDIFSRYDITSINCEMPTANVAVLRLLLAILHTVINNYNWEGTKDPLTNPEQALERWQEWWEKKEFPSVILDYLDTWSDHFWLFHPDYPFLQAETAMNGTQYTTTKLSGINNASNNKPRLFYKASEQGTSRLPYADTVIWMLTTNLFDDCSNKPKNKQDKSKQDKDKKSPGTGWLGKCDVIQVYGNNLFETLMINLVLLDEQDQLYERPYPVWERPIPPNVERNYRNHPNNLAELYTVPFRLFYLIDNQDGTVSSYRLKTGEYFDETNAFIEQHTAWKARKLKKNDPITYTPNTYAVSPGVWSEIPKYFKEYEETLDSKGLPPKIPGIMRWLQLLRQQYLLDTDQITIQIIRTQYDDKKSVIQDFQIDQCQLNLDLFDYDPNLRAIIMDEIQNIHKTASMCGFYFREMAIIKHQQSERQLKAAIQQGMQRIYDSIQEPLMEMLNILCTTEYPQEIVNLWHQAMIRLAYDIQKEEIESLPPGSFLPVNFTENKQTHSYTANSSSSKFYHTIRKYYAEESDV